MSNESIPHMLFDMHCHLDFAEHAQALVKQAEPLGIHAFSATVTPAGYEKVHVNLAEFPSMRVGLGLHPWWVADGRCGEEDIARFEQLAPATRWIGEIGLDFAGTRGEGDARRAQLESLDRILAACNSEDAAYLSRGANPASPASPAAPSPSQPSSGTPSAAAPREAHGQGSHRNYGSPHTPKLISLHAVRAASEVLDALARHDALVRHLCVFHWFSGTSDELTRAVRAGCCFSVNARMLSTKRGRAYARAIPEDRLLLETDLPAREGDAWSARAWRAQLEETLALLADARGANPARLAEKLAQTSARMLDMA